MDVNLFRRIEAAVTPTIEWIDSYLRMHAQATRLIFSLNNPRLRANFPEDLLRRTKTVTVEAIDYPPIASFGLPDFVDRAPQDRQGVTFKDTYFLRQRDSLAEDLHFHELVHIVQWERLGPERFLLAYGVGLAEHGDKESPLEAIAYTLQRQFYEGAYLPRLKEYIEQQTDIVWSGIERRRASLGRL